MTENTKIERVFAHWMARIDGVSNHARIGSLAIVAANTLIIPFEAFNVLSLYVPTLVVAGVVFLGYAWWYSDREIWNAMARFRVEKSTNYAGPSMRIQTEMWILGKLRAEKGRPLTDDEVAAVQEQLDETYGKYRDGYDLENNGQH